MTKIKRYIFFILFIISFGCSTIKTTDYISYNSTSIKTKLSDKEKINWQHKDIIDDSIPGISLDKAYKELLFDKKGDTVIVAVLDTGIDLYHEEFSNIFWKNSKEIENNGYIDDIYGWNFLGNKKGENVEFTNYECVRIFRAYDSIYKNKSIKEIPVEDTLDFKQYTGALKHYNLKLKNAKEALDSYKSVIKSYEEAVTALKPYFPNQNFTIEKLNAISTDDEKLQYYIQEMKNCIENNITYKWLLYKKKWATVRYEKHLGIGGYSESDIIGDNPNDINDSY